MIRAQSVSKFRSSIKIRAASAFAVSEGLSPTAVTLPLGNGLDSVYTFWPAAIEMAKTFGSRCVALIVKVALRRRPRQAGVSESEALSKSSMFSPAPSLCSGLLPGRGDRLSWKNIVSGFGCEEKLIRELSRTVCMAS